MKGRRWEESEVLGGLLDSLKLGSHAFTKCHYVKKE